MNRVWMVGLAMGVAMVAQARSRKPQAYALVTVFTYDRADVPWDVMARAERVATTTLMQAGIEVSWVKGQRLGEPRKVAYGEVRTMVFDGPAPAHASPQAMAFTNVGGRADADIHIFYNRVAGFTKFYWSGAHLSELLGNVLAHELTHALESVARHSPEGLMKAAWSDRDYAQMAARQPLAFTTVDLELLHAHFQNEVPPASSLSATR